MIYLQLSVIKLVVMRFLQKYYTSELALKGSDSVFKYSSWFKEKCDKGKIIFDFYNIH